MFYRTRWWSWCHKTLQQSWVKHRDQYDGQKMTCMRGQWRGHNTPTISKEQDLGLYRSDPTIAPLGQRHHPHKILYYYNKLVLWRYRWVHNKNGLWHDSKRWPHNKMKMSVMESMLEAIMTSTRTSSPFFVLDMKSPGHVKERSLVASQLGNVICSLRPYNHNVYIFFFMNGNVTPTLYVILN